MNFSSTLSNFFSSVNTGLSDSVKMTADDTFPEGDPCLPEPIIELSNLLGCFRIRACTPPVVRDGYTSTGLILAIPQDTLVVVHDDSGRHETAIFQSGTHKLEMKQNPDQPGVKDGRVLGILSIYKRSFTN